VHIRKVLLVDDDPDIRRLGELSLSRVGGWDTVVVASGAEAVESAADGEPPDVIVLDMMMPDMDGMTTLQRLRDVDRTARIPVVFMTAKVQQADIDTYLGAGARGVISKPFDPMLLPGELVQMLSGPAAA
jgi:CheY-like chemotaxis protein